MNSNRIVVGDSFAVLPSLDAESFDACVTDPPYELGFMAKKWDGTGIAFSHRFWFEVLRVLKPGAHLVAFGGTRTCHRMACAIEDAGFEIRDQLVWMYGSGFPKSSNQDGDWEGWSTALKPAWEPIVLARKPLIGTVAANLAEHRTGALNINGCRIPFAGDCDESEAKEKNQHGAFGSGARNNQVFGKDAKPRSDYDSTGRWPANLLHDGSPDVLACFPDTGARGHTPASRGVGGIACNGHAGHAEVQESDMGKGSAARFFFCAKTSTAEREAGLEHFARTKVNDGRSTPIDNAYQRGESLRKNTHPTVKPTDLMRWLCRLVTPPGGKILDPFLGSGSTGRAAVTEGFTFVGIEREPEYARIAEARVTDACGLLASVKREVA